MYKQPEKPSMSMCVNVADFEHKLEEYNKQQKTSKSLKSKITLPLAVADVMVDDILEMSDEEVLAEEFNEPETLKNRLRGFYDVGPYAEFGVRDFSNSEFIKPINLEAVRRIEVLEKEVAELKASRAKVGSIKARAYIEGHKDGQICGQFSGVGDPLRVEIAATDWKLSNTYKSISEEES